MAKTNWILGDLFTHDYGHRGSIAKLWSQRWNFPCTKGVYPFHDGKFSDFEPIFQHLIGNNINDPYSDDYTNAFLPTARRLVGEAEEAQKEGKKEEAIKLYLNANAVFRLARFPYIGTDLKKSVFEEQKHVYLQGTKLWNIPIQEVIIPHKYANEKDGKEIPLYIRHPTSPGPFPTILLITGLDGHRPDNTERTDEFLKRGWAVVIVDIPGTPDGVADRRDPLSPDRLFTSIFEYIASQPIFDSQRVGAWGLSAGGYYAIRLAHTHADKLRGSVGHGAGTHHYIGREWLEQVGKHEYPFGLEEAYAAKYGYKDFEEMKERCQDEFSLISSKGKGVAVVSEGMKSCRLLLVNGMLDGCMPVEDSMLLAEYGRPKEMRFVKDRAHMGYPEANGIVYPWLEEVMGLRRGGVVRSVGLLCQVDRSRERVADRLRKVEHSAHSASRKLSLQMQPANSMFLDDRNTYTYEFIAAPDQQDPVRDLIEDIISKLSDNTSFGRIVSNAKIRVRPATTETPLWPRRRPAPVDYPEKYDIYNKLETKLYTFHQEMEEFPATVTVRFWPYACPLEAKKLQVQQGDQWVPMTKWLVQLAEASYIDRRNAASEICFWYNRGDKPFRFVDLPAELRLAIYGYVIAPYGEVYPLSKAIQPATYDADPYEPTRSECGDAHIILGIGYCIEDIGQQEGLGGIMRHNKSWSKELREDAPAPDISLFFVNKRVSAEALQFAWETPTRCFIDHHIFAAVASSKIGVASKYNVLGNVELSFTCRAWFRFFGISQVSPTLVQDEAASLGYSLELLSSICRLTIRFRNPDDGYEVCDPFCDPWEHERDRSSCQTILNAWIMIFAFKHLKHIQNIEITGYIRKLQRKWILAFYQDPDRHGKEVESRMAALVQEILNTPSHELPPKCECSKDCTTEFSDRIDMTEYDCEECGKEHGTITVSDHNFFDFREDDELDDDETSSLS